MQIGMLCKAQTAICSSYSFNKTTPSHWPHNPRGKRIREADCRCWIHTSLWDQTDSPIFFYYFLSFFFVSFFFPLLFLEVVNSTALGSFQSSLECFGWAGAFFLNLEKPFFLHQWNKISWNYGRALRWKCFWGMFLKRVLFFHVIAWL